MVFESEREKFEGFNTASGKYCCNDTNTTYLLPIACSVSIPQAVSTVATDEQIAHICERRFYVSIPQAVSTVATVLTYLTVSLLRSNVSIPQAVSTVATRLI